MILNCGAVTKKVYGVQKSFENRDVKYISSRGNHAVVQLNDS